MSKLSAVIKRISFLFNESLTPLLENSYGLYTIFSLSYTVCSYEKLSLGMDRVVATWLVGKFLFPCKLPGAILIYAVSQAKVLRVGILPFPGENVVDEGTDICKYFFLQV